MTVSNSHTVRELAVKIPGATRIFEQFKIDYCCGGNRTLAEASAAVGVSTDEVQLLLDRASIQTAGSDEPVDPNAISLAGLIDHIVVEHHLFTRGELDRLDVLAETVLHAHGENHPELKRIRGLVTELGADLRPHMQKEEQLLFPYIVALENAATDGTIPAPPRFGTVRNPVRMMAMEHETAGMLLQCLRNASHDFTPPADACYSYLTLYRGLADLEKDLHQHIHLENNVLFPRAVELEAGIRSR